MNRTSLYFAAPRRVEVRQDALSAPRDDQVLVQVELTGISAGTEMLLYRGEIPEAADATSDTISRQLKYPTTYGYCAVGKVVETGRSVDHGWLGRRVFGFQPHASHFVAEPASLQEVPADIGPDDAVFLPNAETAVNLIQDASPILGERVLVLGQGIVGLLSAALLREFPLECLVTADHYARRREASEDLGVTASFDSSDADFRGKVLEYVRNGPGGFDTVLELSGNPSALNDAIALTAFSGKIVIGSWFGTRKSSLDLGGSYHRSRIRLVASQVSTISPDLSGRWDKARRFSVAWQSIQTCHPAKWITHRFPVGQAEAAYRLLDQSPGDALQVVFEYS